LQTETTHHLGVCACRTLVEFIVWRMRDKIYAKLPVLNDSHIFWDEALAPERELVYFRVNLWKSDVLQTCTKINA
jgi:hypothetical protein